MNLKFHNYETAKNEAKLTRTSSIVFSFGFIILYVVMLIGLNTLCTYYYNRIRLQRRSRHDKDQQQECYKSSDNSSSNSSSSGSNSNNTSSKKLKVEEQYSTESNESSLNLLEEITHLLNGTAPVTTTAVTASTALSHTRSDQRNLRLNQTRVLLLKIYLSVAAAILSVMYAQFHYQAFM